ncbi:MAG: hypothetical protein A2Y10_02955 [Planctomycetes bacterium GWF2_41_51]|nr:MAG: hypothetical protein A2Y10_02955 [Planctomycetes bacterium GWF2_41_51]HBG27510.1 hypothetical protein [Phycisphaerales bacterium]
MSNTKIKSVVLFLAVIMVLSGTPLNAARLAEGEYAIVNGSFENSNSFDTAGWASWLGDAENTITINTDPNKSYYGNNSAKLYSNAFNTVIFQEINVVSSGEGPKVGDAVEGGVWVMFDSEAASDVNGQVLLQVKYVVGSTPTVITTSADIQNKQANKWYYLLTETDELSNGRQIPAGAEKIQIVIDSRVLGTVYVDFAQCGKIGSITGNPSKLAIVEYQTWFGEPDYLPDWRRFTDVNYTGFTDYNNHHWKHWDWGWIPDEGYNSDPGLHKQIGIKNGCSYTFLNSSFEDANYGDANYPGWRRWSPTAQGNIRTNEKAYDGSYSIKYTNPVAGVNECTMWQWIECKDVAHPQDDAPNEKEMVYASVWVNFGDINDVNFAGGNFWIQVRAYHDPDYNPNTNNNEWQLIAKSYEHISPEYLRENANAAGWVQIKTRPVNKSVIPWWTHGLEVAVRFYYAGTVYIDKVEVGEAEYSNVERQIASAKTPFIGPYDSNSDDVISYHLDICKAMLLDAMLINYYGHQYGQEIYQTIVFGKIANQAEDKDLKVCVFYEPKVHLKQWGDVNYHNLMTNVSEMNAVDTVKVNAYIDDVTEYNSITEISDINLVKHYIKMAAIQDDIKYVLDNWSSRKSYLSYRGKPVVGVFGLYASKYDDNMVEQDWADIYANLTQNDASYKFILIGDTVPDWPDLSTWFYPFTGMMNWYLVDDIVRDRMNPTQQDIFERSRDIVNGRTVDWAAGGARRFAIGLTYPQFNDEGVGAWGPVWTCKDQFDNDVYRYYVNRTPVWNGDFYRKNNEGLLANVEAIDWLVIATFNDWNEGSSIEPSIEDGFLYPILTQELIEDFKGIAEVPNDSIQIIAEKYTNTRVKMDVDANIEKQQGDSAEMKTYYKLLIYQFDSLGNYLGELTLVDWRCDAGSFNSNFAGHHANLALYEPCIRLSTQTGKGWVKFDGLSEGAWTETFDSVSNWLAFEGVTISSSASVAMLKDAADGCGGARWIGARVSYAQGDVMILDVNSVYTYGTSKYYSGAGCLKMVLDYEGFNTYTQDQLHNYAVAHNELTDQNTCIDPRGMYLTLNNYEIKSAYNFAPEKRTTPESSYDIMCYWLSYDVSGVWPRPEKIPAIIPLNGNYMDWVVVNGYSSTDNPQTATSYTVNGFWITDPDVNGIGKNIYITADDLKNYYKPIISDDSYNGYYVSILEPPASSAQVKIAKQKIYPNFSGNEKSVIAAAVSGLKDNVLYDKRFKAAYRGSKAGKPIYIDNNQDRYCIVPFIKNGGCSAAIIIDAKTGAFRQASYNDTPDEQYLAGFKNQNNKKGKRVLSCGINPFRPESIKK